MHTSTHTLLGQPARTAAAHVARKAPGLHLIGDLYGCDCDDSLMLDAAAIEAFCLQAVEQAGLAGPIAPSAVVPFLGVRVNDQDRAIA